MKGIYKITNNINNKSYIGKSSDIEGRWNYHISRYNQEKEWDKPLYRAFRKYGIENFSFEILEILENEYDELANQREKYWIAFYQTYGATGYNGTQGGDGGQTVSDPRKVYGKLTTEEVIYLRQRYLECKYPPSYIYEIEFKDDQWVEFKIINKLKLSNNEGGGSSSGESKEIVRTTDSVIESLEPNKIYIATPLSGQLTIESIESPTGIYAEYSVIICLDMISTENMSLVLPSDVMWANGELPDTTKYSTYELSIVYWSGGGAYGFNAVLTPFDFV